MDKKEVAAVLEEIALLLDLSGENPFKVRAYEAGARAVLTFPGDLAAALQSGDLARVKGIGKSLAGVIDELLSRGDAALHRDLKAKTPPGLLELLQVPGLGPKKARVLYDELHITGLGELEYACRENRLVGLAGFGAKSQDKIRAGLAGLKRYAGLFRLGDLLPLAESLTARWRGLPGIERLEVAGPVRRRLEVADGLDLAIATSQPDQVLAALEKIAGLQFASRGSGQAEAALPQGAPLRLNLAESAAFGAAWLAATGNEGHFRALQRLAREHNLELTARGLFEAGALVPCREEADLYRRLGLPLVPPELREDLGEIEAGQANRLPRLLSSEDIKGCFHVHSYYSDGVNSLEELMGGAVHRGWNFLGLSDHSQSAYYAGGLKPPDLERQKQEVEAKGREHPDFALFWGVESDILSDGALDYPDEVLAGFDFVIASIHSQFNLKREAMTQRLLTALANPYCTMLGHASGRLLLAREPYEHDLEAILAFAGAHRVIMEINASPYRLDLDWRWLRRAKELGILISINPDAHSLEGLDDVNYGVMIARKGWLTPEDVINTYPPAEVATILRRRRAG
ncbi:MAG: DNA polymerase/3'-5' exonuclease PolX [Syntrophobacterales bacterium]|jgi:DNA polymerase (family 10)|nr:DNA polymerase/3'-5' exonuclease PolX [Syntrophobacterales bacterium]